MAMASAFVDLALQDIDLLGEYFLLDNSEVNELRWYLKFLRTFLLCARGSGTGSLLNRLEDSLIQNGKDFHNLCLRKKETYSMDVIVNLHRVALQLNNCIISFYQEIMESYVILLDYCSLQFWHQLKEFFDSLLVNLADIVKRSPLSESQETDPFEAFKDKLEFFINFVRLAELRGLQPCQLQVLVTRLHDVAVNAARLCYQWAFFSYGDRHRFFDEFKLEVSELLPKIKPVDPQIREIYVHVLTISNISRSSHAPTLETDKHVLGDFVDTLLSNILKALKRSDSYICTLKDQVPTLYEGLRFLRTVLTKHLDKIDELHKKAKDLIGAAINEAAGIICSLPVQESREGLVKDMDLTLLKFLEMIKLIKVITSAFIFPKSNEHEFIDFLLENLKELLSCKAYSIAFAKDQIQTVQEGLASLRSFLESILDDRMHDGELQSLWNRLVEVAYKTHFVFLSLLVRDIPNCSPLEFRTIMEEINLIKLESLKIVGNDSMSDSKAHRATSTSNPLPSQRFTPAINKIVVTLDDEVNTVIEHLTGGSEKLDIISIVGMPGLGKTTLARSVYDNPSVKDLFHTSAWCVISQAYKKKELLLQILGSVVPHFSNDKYSKKNEEELEEKLRKCLLKKKYLIVLDDIWDIEAWNVLERSFPDDANSSRILLTSRDSEVAKKINPNRKPHSLRQLTDDECWDLLQKKLSCTKSYPLDLGMKIAKNCRGLPLTVVIVAGIIANSDQDGWEQMTRRLSLSAQCMDIVEFSFRKLPQNLKPCFLYLGSFPEDAEIPVKKLISFWIAEGFIEKNETKSLEDVAEDYMNDLIGRSLVMVSKKRSIGGVKTCRIHDLLHEFCVSKAKKRKFMTLLSKRDELFTFHGQHDLQRVCIHSTPQDFEKSKLSCPNVCSLLFFAKDDDHNRDHCQISFIFYLFKLLKVLDLTDIDLGYTFPSEMALLVELRYLAIRGRFNIIPSAIANLSNLETLLIPATNICWPDDIWNMPKLRVLWSFTSFLDPASLTTDKLESSSDLHNLDTFSKLDLSWGSSLEEIMRKLPNIRILKCLLRGSNADCNGIVVLDFLSRLETLHLSLLDIDEYHIGLRLPVNLKKLHLIGFHPSIIPKGAELPNLVVLKLSMIRFTWDTWDMDKECEFPNLKYLKLERLQINRWTGTDGVDHFAGLEKLVLKDCRKLREVPSCLGDTTTLQMIEVCGCGQPIESLIMQIKEYQKDNWGNEDLQVLLTKHQWQ